MNARQAMERSYGSLKRLLREGHFPPGHRLEANRLAATFGVSMTPVRDALNRLVGEQLVEASTGDGFHVPRTTEAALRDLYEWHSALATMVTRTLLTLPDPGDVRAALACSTLADATARLFALLSESSPNAELREAMANAGDRLHPYRVLEAAVLRPAPGELEELLERAPRGPAAIRRYHLTRMRAVPALLRARLREK